MSDAKKNLAESTADAIDEMLRIDGQATITWRQICRALRSGEYARALELLERVRQHSADAAGYAELAAKGVFVLHCAHQLERRDPDKACGADLDALINMTTPPHAKNRDGGN